MEIGVNPAKESIHREGRRNMLLDSRPAYMTTPTDEARMSGWYTGPEEGDEFWPRLREKRESSGMREVVDEIDTASTKVVAHLVGPGPKILVIGVSDATLQLTGTARSLQHAMRAIDWRG